MKLSPEEIRTVLEQAGPAEKLFVEIIEQLMKQCDADAAEINRLRYQLTSIKSLSRNPAVVQAARDALKMPAVSAGKK